MGIEIAPQEPGCITLDAMSPANGTVILGPEAAFSGAISFDVFATQVEVLPITLNKFELASQGKITRGSLVHDQPGHHVCRSCSATYAWTPSQFKHLQKMQGRKRPVCSRPDCPDKPELVWRSLPSESIGIGDERMKRLYEAFSSYADIPVPETRALVPRVWAMYAKGHAPADWAPAPTDKMGQMLQSRVQAKGMDLLPFGLAHKAPTNGLKCFVMEATVSRITEEQVPADPENPEAAPILTHVPHTGMAIGWVSPATLAGGLLEDPQYGYKVRILPAGKNRKKRSRAVC